MPKRTDISKVLIIGSGPIVIGQSAEFDYSGTQACKALKAEGYEVVLVNSNPATIMTDPEMADRTYIEPLTREYLEEIIRIEAEMTGGRGFALLPTVGGQTALNLAVELADGGVLEKYNVELIGAKLEAIKKAEDRLLFKDAIANEANFRELAESRMHGILIAHGPSFRGGVKIDPVENIHIYNLLCAALRLSPAPNDGDDRLVRAFLQE